MFGSSNKEPKKKDNSLFLKCMEMLFAGKVGAAALVKQYNASEEDIVLFLGKLSEKISSETSNAKKYRLVDMYRNFQTNNSIQMAFASFEKYTIQEICMQITQKPSEEKQQPPQAQTGQAVAETKTFDIFSVVKEYVSKNHVVKQAESADDFEDNNIEKVFKGFKYEQDFETNTIRIIFENEDQEKIFVENNEFYLGKAVEFGFHGIDVRRFQEKSFIFNKAQS